MHQIIMVLVIWTSVHRISGGWANSTGLFLFVLIFFFRESFSISSSQFHTLTLLVSFLKQKEKRTRVGL